jgi:hypothetical protein
MFCVQGVDMIARARCHSDSDAPVAVATQHPSREALLYENAYTWLVLGSALDVLLTGVILYGLQGIEANPIAAIVIDHWGLVGASLFKFAMVMLAIILCENIGRMKDATGRRLSWVMAGISFIPVAWSLVLLYATITLPAVM